MGSLIKARCPADPPQCNPGMLAHGPAGPSSLSQHIPSGRGLRGPAEIRSDQRQGWQEQPDVVTARTLSSSLGVLDQSTIQQNAIPTLHVCAPDAADEAHLKVRDALDLRVAGQVEVLLCLKDALCR